MATHSSVLAWRIPWTEEPGGLQSMGSHRVGHNWSDLAAAAACSHSREYSDVHSYRNILKREHSQTWKACLHVISLTSLHSHLNSHKNTHILMGLHTDTVANLHPLPPTSHTHSYMDMLSHLFNRQHDNTQITYVWSISYTWTSSHIHTARMLINTHICINTFTDTAKSLMLRLGHDNTFTFRQDHIHIHSHNLSHTDTHIFTHSCT